MLILVIAAGWFAIVAFAVILCRGAARADAVALDQQRQASSARVQITATRETVVAQRRPRAATARRLSSAARRRERRCLVGS